MALTTPIAFLIFNRPDLTEQVFQAIRQAQPTKLLVVADGPRGNRPGEAEKCAATRKIIDRVDWNCEVLTNYSEVNLGCKRRVSSGIDWVFSLVEEAIILEDDCLPAPSFFQFCQVLLERYREDDRIMMVSGDNFQPQTGQMPAESYYFSKYIHIWGWATWRRAWQHYDVEMASWPEFRDRRQLKAVCHDPIEEELWINIFNHVANGRVDTWDQQWVYACWRKNGFSIMPTINLISNIGFRQDATHTLEKSPWAEMAIGDIQTIRHPSHLVPNADADAYTFDHMFGGKALRFQKTLPGQVIQLVTGLVAGLKGVVKRWVLRSLRPVKNLGRSSRS